MKKIYNVIIIRSVIVGFQSALQNVYAVTTWPPLNRNVDDNKNTTGIWIEWTNNPHWQTPADVLVKVKTPGSSSFVKLRNFAPEQTSYLYKAAKPGEIYQFQIGYCGGNDQSCSSFNYYVIDNYL